MAIPQNIHDEIQNLPEDIRAEVIVDQLIQNNVTWSELVVHCNKFFFRKFSKDIFDAETDSSNDFRDMLHINLSRSGLYDILPEGIFFQPAASSRKPSSATEMAEEYKINKKQELELRKFFSPLEHEFFYHRYKNFTSEKSLLNGLNNDVLNQYFIRFWKLAKDITPAMALRLTLLLPYIHQIAGDAALMAASLQSIVQEKINCSLVNESSQLPAVHFNVLSKFNLGNELVCGNTYHEDEICFVFKIGQLKKSAAQDYLPGGKLHMTLQTFYRFFVPVAATIKTEIILQQSKENMHIGFMEEATLGIATVI